MILTSRPTTASPPHPLLMETNNQIEQQQQQQQQAQVPILPPAANSITQHKRELSIIGETMTSSGSYHPWQQESNGNNQNTNNMELLQQQPPTMPFASKSSPSSPFHTILPSPTSDANPPTLPHGMSSSDGTIRATGTSVPATSGRGTKRDRASSSSTGVAPSNAPNPIVTGKIVPSSSPTSPNDPRTPIVATPLDEPTRPSTQQHKKARHDSGQEGDVSMSEPLKMRTLARSSSVDVVPSQQSSRTSSRPTSRSYLRAPSIASTVVSPTTSPLLAPFSKLSHQSPMTSNNTSPSLGSFRSGQQHPASQPTRKRVIKREPVPAAPTNNPVICAPLPLPLESEGIITGEGNGKAAGITIPKPVPGKRGGGFSCHCCKTSKRNIDDLFLCTNVLPKNPNSANSVRVATLANESQLNGTAPPDLDDGNNCPVTKKCKKKYCLACLHRLYTREYLVLRGPHRDLWMCPSCLNRCTCAGCERRVKGECETPWRRKKSDLLGATSTASNSSQKKSEKKSKSKSSTNSPSSKKRSRSSEGGKPRRASAVRRSSRPVKEAARPDDMDFDNNDDDEDGDEEEVRENRSGPGSKRRNRQADEEDDLEEDEEDESREESESESSYEEESHAKVIKRATQQQQQQQQQLKQQPQSLHAHKMIDLPIAEPIDSTRLVSETAFEQFPYPGVNLLNGFQLPATPGTPAFDNFAYPTLPQQYLVNRGTSSSSMTFQQTFNSLPGQPSTFAVTQTLSPHYFTAPGASGRAISGQPPANPRAPSIDYTNTTNGFTLQSMNQTSSALLDRRLIEPYPSQSTPAANLGTSDVTMKDVGLLPQAPKLQANESANSLGGFKDEFFDHTLPNLPVARVTQLPPPTPIQSTQPQPTMQPQQQPPQPQQPQPSHLQQPQQQQQPQQLLSDHSNLGGSTSSLSLGLVSGLADSDLESMLLEKQNHLLQQQRMTNLLLQQIQTQKIQQQKNQLHIQQHHQQQLNMQFSQQPSNTTMNQQQPQQQQQTSQPQLNNPPYYSQLPSTSQHLLPPSHYLSTNPSLMPSQLYPSQMLHPTSFSTQTQPYQMNDHFRHPPPSSQLNQQQQPGLTSYSTYLPTVPSMPQPSKPPFHHSTHSPLTNAHLPMSTTGSISQPSSSSMSPMNNDHTNHYVSTPSMTGNPVQTTQPYLYQQQPPQRQQPTVKPQA